MGWEFEVKSWVPINDEEYGWEYFYQGDNKDEAFKIISELKE